mmetsp:Transcript_31620/g.73607  ORF Transcript_31620/g.73607 Transcript_31620/m.73607 type:complete len:278 (+) Transcript_31620:755-1588(+)
MACHANASASQSIRMLNSRMQLELYSPCAEALLWPAKNLSQSARASSASCARGSACTLCGSELPSQPLPRSSSKSVEAHHKAVPSLRSSLSLSAVASAIEKTPSHSVLAFGTTSMSPSLSIRASSARSHGTAPATIRKSASWAAPALMSSAACIDGMRNKPESPIGVPPKSALRWSHSKPLESASSARSFASPPKQMRRLGRVGVLSCTALAVTRLSTRLMHTPDASCSTTRSALWMNCSLRVNLVVQPPVRSTRPTASTGSSREVSMSRGGGRGSK